MMGNTYEGNFCESVLEVIRSIRGELFDEVIRKSCENSKHEVKVLFGILNSWADAADLFKEYEVEWILNNVQGVFFTYFWRGSCWIVYEALTGHYLEAFRDLRFMFEGSLLALAYDWLIDSITLEEASSHVRLNVKAELIELAEELRERVKQLGGVDYEKLRDIARRKAEDFVRDKSAELDEEKRKEYVEVYSEVLAQPELYYSIPKLIAEFLRECDLEEFEERLKKAWAELCLYTHFSRKFFKWIMKNPHEIWAEDYDEELLKKCCELYTITIDLLFSTLLLGYPKIHETISKIIKWWTNNLGIKLEMTEKMLDRIGDIVSSSNSGTQS
jgi:hypothetical protein